MEASEKTYSPRSICRACGGPLVTRLDLGTQPLANAFRRADDQSPEPRYPLVLTQCAECELVQLSGVVDPAVMYGPHYPYRSGASHDWALHCHALAKEIGRNKRVLEIGCLDGVMLRHCRDNGCEVQGVDPSSPVQDLPILREFFGAGWKTIHTGQYDVIVAQNVFGHVDDCRGFLEAVAANLSPDGYAVIECPWVTPLIAGTRWDTIYHEHLSYWGVKPLRRLAESTGLVLYEVKRFPGIHGGTLRYYLTKKVGVGPSASVYLARASEDRTDHDWHLFRERVAKQIDHWERWFADNESWTSVAAYGASAKLTVFLNALSERPPILAVFDDAASKIGLRTPGWHIPVLAPSRQALEQIDVLLVGSPNWKDEIERNARAYGFTGEVLSLWD